MIGAASAANFSPERDYCVTAVAEEYTEGLYETMFYLKYSDHIVITRCGAPMRDDQVIPSEIEGVPVTAIRAGAFENSSFVKAITIPDSVTDIGEAAFKNCESLTSVTLPDSIKSIKKSTFEGCTGLTSIEIPDSVTEIGEYAFRGCEKLASVALPSGIKSIRNYTFSGCKGLSSIEIPDGVTDIMSGAFYVCSSLSEIRLPESVESIGQTAFGHCPELNAVYIMNPECEIYREPQTFFGYYEDRNDENSYDMLFFYFNGTIYGYEGSTAQSYAKSFGRKFVSLEDPSAAVTTTTTATATAQKTTTTTSLPMLTGGIYNDLIFIVDSGHIVITDCDEAASGEIVIPESIRGIPVTAVGKAAFSRCKDIQSVTIPESVKSIGEAAFSGCPGLASVVILDPECEIFDSADTFCENEAISFNDPDDSDFLFSGTIYGYAGSTAQAYAEKYGRSFSALDDEDGDGLGDVNSDGMIDAVDASEVLAEYARVSTQQGRTFDDRTFRAADVNSDGFTDAADASLILSYYAYASVAEGTPMTMKSFLRDNN